MKVILFSTGCPRCRILENKLEQQNIEFETCKDTDVMITRGLQSAPALDVDGTIMEFVEAIKWAQGVKQFEKQQNDR